MHEKVESMSLPSLRVLRGLGTQAPGQGPGGRPSKEQSPSVPMGQSPEPLTTLPYMAEGALQT